MIDFIPISLIFLAISAIAVALNRTYILISHLYFNQRWFYVPFSLFGVAIHEISHLLLVIVFNHRIVDVKLFDQSSFLTGHVVHAYNEKNPYHVIGTMFIAIAPMLIMTGLFYLIALSIFQIDFYALSGLNTTSPFELGNLLNAYWTPLTTFVSDAYTQVLTLELWSVASVFALIILAVFAAPSETDLQGFFRSVFLNYGLTLFAFFIIESISSSLYDWIFNRFLGFSILFIVTLLIMLTLVAALILLGHTGRFLKSRLIG